VTGKVGYAFDNLLASVRAGWASATVEYATNLNGVVSSSSSEREGGWTAALGIEYAVLPNVILGVEYDYIRINAGGTGAAPVLGSVSDGGVDIQTVLARLSCKFGESGVAGSRRRQARAGNEGRTCVRPAGAKVATLDGRNAAVPRAGTENAAPVARLPDLAAIHRRAAMAGNAWQQPLGCANLERYDAGKTCARGTAAMLLAWP
jgi:hypothetical protein